MYFIRPGRAGKKSHGLWILAWTFGTAFSIFCGIAFLTVRRVMRLHFRDFLSDLEKNLASLLFGESETFERRELLQVLKKFCIV